MACLQTVQPLTGRPRGISFKTDLKRLTLENLNSCSSVGASCTSARAVQDESRRDDLFVGIYKPRSSSSVGAFCSSVRAVQDESRRDDLFVGIYKPRSSSSVGASCSSTLEGYTSWQTHTRKSIFRLSSQSSQGNA